MNSIAGWLARFLIVAAIVIGGLAWLGPGLSEMFISEAEGAERCAFKFCQDNAFKRAPRSVDFRTNWENGRIKVGDLYDAGTGRIQIRNNSRQVLGYIEGDGTITNTNRQSLGEIEGDRLLRGQ